MTVINTNNAASITANALTKNERAMSQAMERLSTGQRINSAGDDAAGLAISSRMTSQINGLNMAVRNANDAISMVQTEDGAMVEVANMLQRMRELAVQAASGTMGSTDRTALNTEFSALAAQIQQVGDDTMWNGTLMLDGSGVSGAQSFQVGANASQTIDHTFAVIETGSELGTNTAGSRTDAATSGTVKSEYEAVAFDTGTAVTFVEGDTLSFSVDSVFYAAEVTTVSGGQITGVTMHGSSAAIGTSYVVIDNTTAAGDISLKIDAADSAKVQGTTATDNADFTLANVSVNRGILAATQVMDISTAKGAANAIKSMDHGLAKLNSARASSGAVINRLEYAADNLANVSQNTSASRSRILDADYASETTELARTQIIQQAATAMLSQANQQAQSVLALLK
jgi:flagellin